jgi:hypothetical protein
MANPKATFDYMWNNSGGYLESRFNRGYSEALQESIKSAENYNSSWGDWTKFLSSLVRGGDIGAIIYGGYPYVMYLQSEAGGNHTKAQAMEKFRLATINAQQSGLASSRSQFQNSRNALARLFLAFKNTSNQYFRKMVDATIQVSNGDISKQQYAKVMTIYAVIQPTLYAAAGVLVKRGYRMLGDLLTGEPEDDEELGQDLAEAIILQLAINPVTAIPVFDDIAAYAARKAMGLKTYGVMNFPMLSDIESGIQKLGKRRISASDYIEAAGSVLEVGTAAPIKTYVRIYKYMFEE